MSKKTKTKSDPWKPAQPAIMNALNTSQDLVSQNQPRLQSIAGDIEGQLPQLQHMAFGEQPGLQGAQDYNSAVMGGQYLNSNPFTQMSNPYATEGDNPFMQGSNQYLDGLVGSTNRGVTDQINSLFSKAGVSMSSAHAGNLSRGLADSENGLRAGQYNQDRNLAAQTWAQNRSLAANAYGQERALNASAYGQERAAQGAAAGMAPALTQAQYAGIMPYLATAQAAGQLPYAGMQAIQPTIALAGGAGTSTQAPNFWQSLSNTASNAAQAYAASGSDPRMKENVVKVGEYDDGLGVYEFDYKDGLGPKGRFRGVMADEVRELRPQAYIANFHGDYAGVDYAKLEAR